MKCYIPLRRHSRITGLIFIISRQDLKTSSFIYTPMMPRIISQFKDPLYKNSFFIMLNSLSSAGFGLFFWMLAANSIPKKMWASQQR
jgi:hypothetical protein